jgi:hypothetical protein
VICYSQDQGACGEQMTVNMADGSVANNHVGFSPLKITPRKALMFSASVVLRKALNRDREIKNIKDE